MVTIRRIPEMFTPMFSACLVLAVVWGSVRVPKSALGKPGRQDDTQVAVTVWNVPGGVGSDNLGYDADGNLVLIESMDHGVYAWIPATRKVRALIDGNSLLLRTWDSRQRGLTFDFTLPVDPEDLVRGNLRVDIGGNFLEMGINDDNPAEQLGFATITFPVGREHYQLEYSAWVTRVSDDSWEIDSFGPATFVDVGADTVPDFGDVPFSVTVDKL